MEMPVRSGDDQVVQLHVLKYDFAANTIVNYNLSIQRITKSNYRVDAVARLFKIAAATVVTYPCSGRHLSLTALIKFFLAAIAMISLVFVKPLINYLAVTVHALSLKKGTFIDIQTEPLHSLENSVNIFIG